MIVAPFFKGDMDMEVASKQHDVYGQALWIIVSKCHRYTEFARSLLNDADHPEWGTVEHFDHRTLQHGHDLLAAVWRFRNDFQQPVLPFVDKKSLDELQTLWLDWLRHEIAGWIDYPHRVRLVQLILTNQNKLPGYIAEAQLSLDTALLHDSTAARVGALFQLLVQGTTAQDFGLPSSAIRLRM